MHNSRHWTFLNVVGMDQSVIVPAEKLWFENQLLNSIVVPNDCVVLVPDPFHILCDVGPAGGQVLEG